ncbi:MAG: N-acetylmuramoyl-L-alanine amidase [Clostridia bacterium]|nr:N-acetylmuramoyl-L-alanine amidase [Clostridia bacterium]
MRKSILKRRMSRRKRKQLYTAIGFAGAAVLLLAAIALVIVLTRPGESAEPGTIRAPDYVTEDFLVKNEYSRPGKPLEKVNGIVIHYVGNPNTTAKNNRNYFNNLPKINLKNKTEVYASAHFIVGLEGEIIQCIPLSEIAYASNTRNSDTIAIENCHPDETGEFNGKTYASLVKLAGWLCYTYDLKEDQVIRHYDVKGKLCPLYYVEHEDAWLQLKADIMAEKEALVKEAETGR